MIKWGVLATSKKIRAVTQGGLYVVAVVGLLYLYFSASYCTTAKPAIGSQGKNVVLDKSGVDQSYVLLSSYAVLKDDSSQGVVYLTDLFGKAVHTWKTKYQTRFAILKKNGDLLVALLEPANPSKFPGGGRFGIIQELDWEGNILWEYKNEMMHHDFELLPNGNLAIIIWEKVPPEIAKKIKGGVPNTEFRGEIWSDAIREIDRSGKTVWEWHGYEHLKAESDLIAYLAPRAEWMHTGSIKYVEKNPIDFTEAFLLSMPNINTVAIVRKSDGEIIWKSPRPMFAGQHNALLTPGNTIIVFDNLYRRPGHSLVIGSRVVEINPITNKIVWELDGGKQGTEKARFAPPILNGAERLSNGNTFVFESTRGHLFEVTPDKKLVWDFINPYEAPSTGPWKNNVIFRAARYGMGEIEWPERIASPLPKLPLLCQRMGL